MKHRKKEHRPSVPKCRNSINGTCKYGSIFCWFTHDDLDTNDNDRFMDEKNEVIQKLIEMMERMTERIVKIEENSRKENDHKITKENKTNSNNEG